LADFAQEEQKIAQGTSLKNISRPKTSGNYVQIKKRAFEYCGDANLKEVNNVSPCNNWIAHSEYSIFNNPQVYGTSDSDNKQSPPRSLKKPAFGEKSSKT
jgi:hypothetical protein